MDQNVNPEKEAQAAVEQVLPGQKKPGRKALQIFAIIVLLGLVAGGVYFWQNSRVAQLESQVTELKRETATDAKVATDPYAGWKDGLAKYEKLTFKFPAAYKLTDTSQAANSQYDLDRDIIKLQGPNNFVVSIQTGIDGVGGMCEESKVVSVESLNLLGKSLYNNYYPDTGSMVSNGFISSASNSCMPFFEGENIMVNKNAALVSITYGYVNPADGAGVMKDYRVLEQDANVKTAKQIIQSMSY